MTGFFDIVDNIQQLDPRSEILITSYKFNLDFFEKHIFSHFRPPSYPLIFIDSTEYRENEESFLKSKNAGRRYFVERIDCDNTFHPKLFFATYKNKFDLIIGSNNLTWSGYTRNAELVTHICIDDEHQDHSILLNDLKDFLQGLKELTQSNQIKQHLGKIIDSIPNQEDHTERQAWLLHNIKKGPLLFQIRNIIPEPIERIHILCPYFSQDKAIYDMISEMSDEIYVYIQQKTSNLPINTLEDFHNFNYLNVDVENNRFLHAKILFVETKSTNYCFSGSANFTDSALLTDKNVELGVLISTKMSFEKLLRQIGTVENIALSEIESQKEETIEFEESINQPKIIEAALKENRIVLTLEEIEDLSQLAIEINGVIHNLPYEIQGNSIIFTIDDTISTTLKSSAIIKLVGRQGNEELTTQFRLLFNKIIFPDEFHELNHADIDDINWLFKILNKLIKLPNLNEYFRILDEIDKKGILESKQKKSEIHNFDFTKGPYNPNEKLNDLISRFIDRHERRINHASQKCDQSEVGTVLYSLILTNKLILWSIYREIKPINELYKIKNNFKPLFTDKNNYIDKLDPESIEKCMNDYHLRSHVAMLVYLIDYMQLNSREFKPDPRLGYNAVKQVFETCTVQALEKIIEKSDPLIKQREFKEVLQQYSEIIPELKYIPMVNFEMRLNELIDQLSIRDPNHSYCNIQFIPESL